MIYQHYNGGLYKFLHEGYDEATEEKVVIYQSLETDIIWVRNWYDFHGDVEVTVEDTIHIFQRFKKFDN